MSNTTFWRNDVYARVTDRVLADPEAGVRRWLKPWKAGNAEGRIAIPRRHNGTPYRGIKFLLLWGAALAKGYSSPLWMTFRAGWGTQSTRAQGRARLPRGLCGSRREDQNQRTRAKRLSARSPS